MERAEGRMGSVYRFWALSHMKTMSTSLKRVEEGAEPGFSGEQPLLLKGAAILPHGVDHGSILIATISNS